MQNNTQWHLPHGKMDELRAAFMNCSVIALSYLGWDRGRLYRDFNLYGSSTSVDKAFFIAALKQIDDIYPAHIVDEIIQASEGWYRSNA